MKSITSLIGTALIVFIGLAGCDSVDAGPDSGASATVSDTFESDALGKKSDNPKWDVDDNGVSDAGIFVTGSYTALYAYDAGGDWYWDLGDGRIQGTVGSVDDLDSSTLTTCDYVNNYRADFGNDPYMDAGWIQNHINCSGYDDNGMYNYLIVHESDRRYTGNPDYAIWGTWEYIILTQQGDGNLVDRSANPLTNVGS